MTTTAVQPQQTFAESVYADPEMTPEQKARWLWTTWGEEHQKRIALEAQLTQAYEDLRRAMTGRFLDELVLVLARLEHRPFTGCGCQECLRLQQLTGYTAVQARALVEA